MQGSSGLTELRATPIHPRISESISCLRFSTREELLWSGTESGALYGLQSPSLNRYCCSQSHASRICGLALYGDGAASVSSTTICYHAVGGLCHLRYTNAKGSMAACEVESSGASRLLVGGLAAGEGTAGQVSVLDLSTGQFTHQGEVAGGVQQLKGGIGRGLIAAGVPSGQVVLLDPRTGFAQQASMAAHAGGLACMDARSDLVATCGRSTRQGHVVPDIYLKVFDIRSTPRVLSSVQFRAGPAMLAFHPKFTSTLLVASPAGVFSLIDAQISAYQQTMQVETEGDTIQCCAISSTGEVIAFGGNGGYAHIWAGRRDAHVNAMSQPLPPPAPRAPPRATLAEHDSFARAPQYALSEGKLLSALDTTTVASKYPAPRVIDMQLLGTVRQVDFIGFVANPHYGASKPAGEATRKAAPMRNKRAKPKAPISDRRELARREGRAKAGTLLPGRYRAMRIKQQTGVRYEQFDFGYYNRTRFAGLENDLANCYANPLLQVLYFMPAFREAMLAHVPSADKEFSLTGELALLFRMLHSAQSEACQAANLLRALRQSRDARALGLVEGQLQPGKDGNDIEMTTSLDPILMRRIHSLQRFLLGNLHRESSPEATAASPAKPAAQNGSAASTKGSEVSAAEAVQPSSFVKELFGLGMRQRTVSTTRQGLEKTADTTVFQLELKYPPASERPAMPGSSGTKKGSSGPAAPANKSRPSFSDLLQGALRPQSELRVWWDDSLGYQTVRQTCVPTSLPQVLVVGTGVQDADDVAWWQPLPATSPQGSPQDKSKAGEKDARPSSGQDQAEPTKPWTPWFVSVSSQPEEWRVDVREGATLDEVVRGTASSGQPPPPGSIREMYELTAVIALVRDMEGMGSPSGLATKEAADDGHLLAHIKVLPPYLDPERGVLPDRLTGPSPRHAALARMTPQPSQGLPIFPKIDTPLPTASGTEIACSMSPPQPPPLTLTPGQQAEVAADAAAVQGHPAGSAGSDAPEHNLPDDLDDLPDTLDEDPSPMVPGASAEGSVASHTDNNDQDDRQRLDGSEAAASTASSSIERQGSAASSAGTSTSRVEGTKKLSPDADVLGSPLKLKNLRVPRGPYRTGSGTSLPGTPSTPSHVRGGCNPQWMLFNDFCVTVCSPAEVLQLFGGSKIPCLLYYTRVTSVQQSKDIGPPQPAPVLTPETFSSLCSAQPVQGANARLRAPSCVPLSLEELQQPQLLLGLDAEFVALSAPHANIKRSTEVEARPSRLGLARVSMVRGSSGERQHQACIDDYIASREPVYDHLTKYSGLEPGDLDPAMSPYPLITLRQAYLKLRFLVDRGSIFVGHGLKKDFRMLNIVVPANQVVDTVELFHARNARKLSLRFLASYLLNLDIQAITHDSITDARTALQLFQVYQKLQADGTFEAKLAEMYRWGQQFGWEPGPRDTHT
ncbi:hypothetical protein WJX84_006968 [Apatococcus fuscideae]|uniref:Exonuclease domain-containing protein n=1 Tax=Apatococcus fuscideae TaxID=2026836 RepID=A0AAW1TA89_9CHLO